MNDIDENKRNEIIEFNNKFSNKKQQNHIFTYNDNIHFLELHTLLGSGGTEFLNNSDNIYLDNIIKSKYKFNIMVP